MQRKSKKNRFLALAFSLVFAVNLTLPTGNIYANEQENTQTTSMEQKKDEVDTDNDVVSEDNADADQDIVSQDNSDVDKDIASEDNSDANEDTTSQEDEVVSDKQDVNQDSGVQPLNNDVSSEYDVKKDENKSYLSDRNPSGYQSPSIKKDTDNSGGVISLLENGKEKTYQKGLSTHAYSSVYYTDIQENGYTRFTADVGIAKSARTQVNNNYAKVTFKVLADGQEVFNSGVMNAKSDLKHVDIDLTNVEVLQLVVDQLENNSYDHAVWADAGFVKDNKNSPWLEVNPLEFNLPQQVTESNILEYADAKDYKGTDISSKITYTTNYVDGQSGDFTVTYTVTDDENNSRTRTVPMKVTNEDYSQRLSLERLRQPWASYLYHGRGTLPRQGQKAWDVVLKEILDFKPEKWKETTYWGTPVYAVVVNLQQNGIYATRSEVDKLQTMMVDDEPRTFILPDWSNGVTMKDGIAETITVYVRKNLGDNYDQWLQKIEENTVKMLEEVKYDMDEAQRVYFVLKKYASWLQYGAGGQMLHEALGNGVAVCGGNARGTVYLTSRVGVKSIFGRSGSHAWSYSKLYNENEWYKNDLLAGPAILVDAFSSKHNLQVGGNYLTRHYEWFDFIKTDYDRKKLQYPSVWLNLSAEQVMLVKGQEYNLLDYVSGFGSVTNESLTKQDIRISVRKVDEEGNVYSGVSKLIPTQGNGDDLQAGTYQVRYTLVDGEKNASKVLNVYIPTGAAERKNFSDKESHTGNVSSANRVGLYDGKNEKYYTNAIVSSEAGSITFDVSNKNYKYVTLDYGIKDSVRQNTDYGSYGIVQLEVYADDKLVYTSKTLGWKDHYESIKAEIPQGTKKVTLKSKSMGSGNNHAGLGNLSFVEDTTDVEGLPNYTNGISFEGNAQKANGGVNLFDGQNEKTYKDGFTISESGAINLNVQNKNYRYVAFDFGIKGSVRQNTSYGYYGKVKVQVLADNKVIYTGETVGWKDKYQQIKVRIPKNTSKVTIKNIPLGYGNNHAGLANLRFVDAINGVDGSPDYYSTSYYTGNMVKTSSVGLYDGTKEVYYTDALVSKESGSMTFDIQNKDYTKLSLDFGIIDSVRQNTSYGSYGKVQLQVIIDGKTVYTSRVLGWKDKFESVEVNIPKDARSVTIKSIAKGYGNNHAGIGNLNFTK